MDFQDLDQVLYKELENEILYSAIEEEYEKKIKKDKRRRKSKTSRKNDTYAVTTLKSGLKIKTVLLLLLTLIVNTYAWFIYISTVSMDMLMHVKDWSFELSNGEQTENFEFNVEQIYPGMDFVDFQINAKNSGETGADLSCEILTLKVLEEEYITGNTYIDEDGSEKTYTSDDLFEILTNYPFKVQVYFGDNPYNGTPLPMPTTGEVDIRFTVDWPYETGNNASSIATNDAIDTYYGEAAHQFMIDHPDEDSIRVQMKIVAVQNNDI